MKKLINYRPLFYCFLAFSIGIGFANFILAPNYLIIAITLLATLGIVIICFINRIFKRLFYILIAFIIGIGAFFIDANNFSRTKYDGAELLITGRISNKVSKYDGFAYLILENVYIDGKSESNINVCISGYNELEKIETGNHMAFISEIYNEFLFENNKFNYFAYSNNAPYFCFTSYEDVVFEDGDLILSEKLKNHIQNFYADYMSVNGSQFAYNMLFGEKTELNREIKESFGISGIAHLLAVSGLNINFLVLILFLFLNKFNLGKFKKFFIIAVILFLYAYMCNFTASVVRASLMCLVFLSSGLFARPYDLLNSIAISGFIILAFAPLMIFDAGFQMSFVCVLAIAFFIKSLTAFFKKARIPNALSSALAIDVSTTIAIIPLLGIYFGRLSILTTFINLICVPLFAFSYMLLVVITVLGMMFNFFGLLLLLPDLALKIMISLTCFVADIEMLVLTLPHMDIIWLILFYGSLFILSGFFLVNFLDKVIIINAIAIICVTLTLIFNLPTVPKVYTYTQLNSSDPCSIITTSKGEVLVIGGTKNIGYVTDYLNYKHISQVNYLVVTSENSIEKKETEKFIFDFKVEKIIYNETDAGEIGSFNVEFIYLNELKKGVLVSVNDFEVLFACDVYLGVNQIEILKQKFEGREIDVLFSKKETQGFFDLATFDLRVTTFKQNLITENKTCSLYSFGTFTFDFENGKIEKLRKV